MFASVGFELMEAAFAVRDALRGFCSSSDWDILHVFFVLLG
jgi:hypothetical protein